MNDGTNTVSVFTKLLPEKQVFGNVDTKEFKMDFYPFGNSTGGKLEVTYKDKSYFTIKVEKLTGGVKVVEDEKLE